MRYVLDTNALIYFFKGLGNVSEILLSKSPGEINIPSIVLFEIEFGIRKSSSPEKRKVQLKDFLSVVSILPFGGKEAICAADIRADLEHKGLPIGPFDILIAATALAYNATLVTHNLKEFKRVNGLRLEDWY